ncbi:CapA family protein [Patescibacteria group bacterium]|nr:CapA family protein [Patescibacteria group bacterium]
MISKNNLIWAAGAGVVVVAVALIVVTVLIEPGRLGGAAFLRFWQNEPVVITPSASLSPAPSASPVEEIKLLFLGDLMFDRNIRQIAAKNGNNFIFAPAVEFLVGNDLVVANLEGPITDNKSVSLNTAPGSDNNFVFTFEASLASTLFDNNIRLVSLGNNHILNFGQIGLKATKQYLNGAGVSYFGAPGGERGIIKEIKGVKIALVNYNQFIGSILVEPSFAPPPYKTTDGHSEATAGEQAAAIEEIKKVKMQADVVILYAHWGIEHENEANGVIKNLAHEFINAGADLIIGSHPHVIQSAEEYNGKMIYYSLGNFVFDQYFSEAVRQGLGVIVKINSETQQLKFEEKKLYLRSNGQTALLEP